MTTLHLVSHTHWDREWHLTFQQFRLQLVDLVDGVLEGHASAVLAASIFHYGEYTVQQAKAHMAKAGITVRL